MSTSIRLLLLLTIVVLSACAPGPSSTPTRGESPPPQPLRRVFLLPEQCRIDLKKSLHRRSARIALGLAEAFALGTPAGRSQRAFSLSQMPT